MLKTLSLVLTDESRDAPPVARRRPWRAARTRISG
jgi:hypothetical protein